MAGRQTTSHVIFAKISQTPTGSPSLTEGAILEG